ncbi:Uncharacterized protein Fot_55319 [Forsythia ovata]|uniref:Uncharacterized protein n=1 Tax=Forsythia ovata TaxID=205694 RepID=A0ABD1P580_9LAMI
MLFVLLPKQAIDYGLVSIMGMINPIKKITSLRLPVHSTLLKSASRISLNPERLHHRNMATITNRLLEDLRTMRLFHPRVVRSTRWVRVKVRVRASHFGKKF